MIVSLVSRQFTRQALRASRFYGTETSSAVYPVEKGGSAKVWLIALAGMAAMVGWTELDRRITDDGKKEHPIAKWVDSLRTDKDVWIERSEKHANLVKQSINDFFIFSSAKRPRMYRLTDTLAFERASPFGKSVSSHVDLSDLRIRNDITV